MALKKLPIGIEDFEKMRRGDYYYVDKTNLIVELLENLGEVNLFARPRRFGKSLNMSMLKNFFEIGSDKSLFDGLDISREQELCAEHMGKYPVINLSLKQVQGRDFQDAENQLRFIVCTEIRRHRELIDSDRLAEEDKASLAQLRRGQGDLGSSIYKLSELLYNHYGQKAILLIDEYDVPLQKADEQGYYCEMVSLISQFFGYSMKTNMYMAFAVVTGCLRISKESIFTGFNNPKMHTIADERYDEWFGFTDAEVREMLAYYDRSEYYDLTKEWYDGYLFGKVHVYCPWDVTNWCDKIAKTSGRFPDNYWANSSDNSLILRFVDLADRNTKNQLGALLEGKSVWKKINFELTYGELDDTVENIWSVLFMTGYLTFKGRDGEGAFELVIPNREIKNLFKGIVEKWFSEKVLQDEAGRTDVYDALDTEDAKIIEENINYILEDSVSYLDGGRIAEKENFYHGLMLGILNSRPGWIAISNREAGYGRLDIATYPRRGKDALIFELKYVKEYGELEGAAEDALKQISAMDYDRYFTSRSPEKITHYGIAFCKKRCFVVKG